MVAGDVPTGPWFRWHADRISVPPAAEVLADSPDGPEVFRVGTSAGMQFHPEMSPALLDRRLEVTPLPAEREAALRRDAARHEGGAPELAELLLRALDLVRARGLGHPGGPPRLALQAGAVPEEPGGLVAAHVQVVATVTDRAVDQLAADVGVTRVPVGLGGDVHQDLLQCHLGPVGGPVTDGADGVEVELGDRGV
jgi:hypothetical protein